MPRIREKPVTPQEGVRTAELLGLCPLDILGPIVPEPNAWDELISKNPELQDLGNSFTAAIDKIGSAIERGSKLMIAGNGGSMSDALHISGELLKAYRITRAGYQDFPDQLEPGIPVRVLGINPTLTSAVENDLPERASVFAQELKTSVKVSAKRLEKKHKELEKKV